MRFYISKYKLSDSDFKTTFIAKHELYITSNLRNTLQKEK
jgi:hypothetical protein